MKRLVRNRTERKIAGVCGGLGELLGWDPTLVRLAVVFVGVATGVIPVLFAYGVAWAIVPEEGTVPSSVGGPPPPPQATQPPEASEEQASPREAT